MQLAEYLHPYPDLTWDLSIQAGVTHAVSNVPPDGPEGDGASLAAMKAMQKRFADRGLTLAVIETGFPWLHHAKIGGPNAEAEIKKSQEFVKVMGELGIRVSCMNWMAVFNWTRTRMDIPARGGALVTGYNHQEQSHELTVEGIVTEQTLWDNLRRFQEAVVPVAEESGVFIALHPDDPPISPIRGVSRILTSPENMMKATNLVPSKANGITMCQGSFSTMGADVPAEIRRFGEQGKIGFVHFRDVVGTPDNFAESFHDIGQTDMWEAMRTYSEIGWDGPVRPDHVPTMAGESNDNPGYQVVGRLFAIGYMKGLHEAASKSVERG